MNDTQLLILEIGSVLIFICIVSAAVIILSMWEPAEKEEEPKEPKKVKPAKPTTF